MPLIFEKGVDYDFVFKRDPRIGELENLFGRYFENIGEIKRALVDTRSYIPKTAIVSMNGQGLPFSVNEWPVIYIHKVYDTDSGERKMRNIVGKIRAAS